MGRVDKLGFHFCRMLCSPKLCQLQLCKSSHFTQSGRLVCSVEHSLLFVMLHLIIIHNLRRPRPAVLLVAGSTIATLLMGVTISPIYRLQRVLSIATLNILRACSSILESGYPFASRLYVVQGCNIYIPGMVMKISQFQN
jgi:hypothetical protein